MKFAIASVVAASAIAGVAATVGDEVPKAMPVLNVMLEEPLYGYADAMRAAQYKASEAKLAALKGMSDSTRAATANLIRANSAKLEKASHMASFMKQAKEAASVLNSPAMDAEAVKRIEAQLSHDCGEPCLKFFEQLKVKMLGKDPKAWQGDLVAMMQDQYQKVQAVYKDELATSKLAATFLKHKAHMQAKFNLVDVPCKGEMCALVEVVANKCNYGRVASLATYNAVNLALHVFSVVINALCGGMHVGPVSVLIIDKIPFVGALLCKFPYAAFSGLQRMSTQVWQSGVTGSTKMCNMIGDFRVAAPQPSAKK